MNTSEKISELAKKQFQNSVSELLDQSFWYKYNSDLFKEIESCIDVEISSKDNCGKIGFSLKFSSDWVDREWFFDLEEEFRKTFTPEKQYFQEGLLRRAETMDRLAEFFRETAINAPKFSNQTK
jgi:elongation factor P hydroxylase